MFLRQRQHAEDAPDAGFPFMPVDVIADGARRGADAQGRVEQRHGLRRGAPRAIDVGDPVPAARGSHVLAQQLAGLGIEQADDEIVPLHVDATPDPAGRRAVVRGLDFHAPIQMHRPDAEAVIAKWLERQRAERRLLLDKDRSDLALRRAVDARIGPVRFPAIEVRLRLVERFEAQSA
jgi:hypothetical protein